ncbi:hypothetical protein HOLDEFILI_02470 [Holdemania filiformis DSM 12042]|uniref:Uncharacterized protein n=1 Tax=Holdemania filiformis DSM 12042 TaxID=545696 RepID=B9Y9G4_9FIRM|nr:hypothetical protein HOLDEFILI_02470 [Holdemania filiformis DSM 12042]
MVTEMINLKKKKFPLSGKLMKLDAIFLIPQKLMGRIVMKNCWVKLWQGSEITAWLPQNAE